MKRLAPILLIAMAAAGFFALQSTERPTATQPATTPVAVAVPWQLAAPDVPAPETGQYAGLPDDTIQALRPARRPEHPPERVRLPLPEGDLDLRVYGAFEHANGDLSLVAGARHPAGHPRALVTVSDSGVFGRVSTKQEDWLVTTDATGTWLVQLGDPRLSVDAFGHDAVGAVADLDTLAAAGKQTASAESGPEATETVPRIDVMFLYTPPMAERYPGGLLETRFNHFVTLTNRSMTDSRVRASVRLVGFDLTDYDREQSASGALSDLRLAVSGEGVPGFEDLASRRQQLGADIVALIWPHDIETRGACGIAYLPVEADGGGLDPDYGVQVTNDGASNWSVCSDAVFAHEIGHNLGANHQREVVSQDDPQSPNYAWVRERRWHTIMGSFGTGHVDRYRRLLAFSNPDLDCGGEPCGSDAAIDGADNAAYLSSMAAAVAGHVGQAGSIQRDSARSTPDQDGDGRSDWVDSFPFDPHDGEPPPDAQPALAFQPRRLATGGEAPAWEILIVDSEADVVRAYDLEGGERGVAAQPDTGGPGPVLTAYSDLFTDDAGRLYLLASEDLRRYDRLTGRRIDVFLDSAKPEPRELPSAFPRAVGRLDASSFMVLGDTRMAVYDFAGNRLNGSSDNEPTDNPQSWSQAVDLPLRAVAANDTQFFVAEAAGNRIMTFDGNTGWRDLDVAGPDNGRISDPRDLVVGPDGLLYLANGAAGNVLRYDPEARAFVDEFVAAGAGGLEFARALAFGPDESLYVSDRGSGRVLRYEAGSGAFSGVVVTAGAGGLAQPEAITIAPVVDQVGPGHSGHFFAADRSGEGWLLEILDSETAAVSWFTYPPAGSEAGEQAWIVGVGRIEGRTVVFEDLLATRLIDPEAGIFFENLETEPWGELSLEFFNCRRGRARWDSPLFSDSGSRLFERLLGIAGLPCGSAPLEASEGAPGISGQWSDPDSDGQGWFFQELGGGEVFTAWFTYDGEGRQAWIVGQGRFEGRSLVFEELVMTRGTRFGPDFDSADVENLPWGRLTVTFDSCLEATAEYQSDLPAFGEGTLHPERLTRLADHACDLAPLTQ
jgi:hypothetical protein